ncbi:hypothetical protein [Nocardioides sp.]|uniref:hypothetical protein n=1 Tax=Nocardioides sp. TaxID=35761 RepID=UPI001996E69A|nr:hypothetical protein [Nocardioides sp.]MBC7274991.1 hypothetical protein [Nocardioides sp.]
MARKQTAILSVNRGVTTLNGLVVDRPWGEDPHQAGIRAVREQLAGPSRKPVEVVATDDDARVRMLVHPDGQVTDVETLEVFGTYASPGQAPGAAWLPASAPTVVQGVAEPVEEPEPEVEEPYVPPVLAVPAPVAEPEPEPVEPEPVEPEPEPEPDPEPESEPPPPPPAPPTGPPPAPVLIPEPMPEPESGPEAESVAEPVSRKSSGPLVPLHHMEPGPYRRSRMTRRGRVVLVIAAVLLLILVYEVVRGVVTGSDAGSSDKEPQSEQSAPTAGASDEVIEPPSEATSPSAPPSSGNVEPTPKPTPKPTPTPTKKPKAEPAPTRKLSVEAIAMTEAIGLRIDTSRLPVTARIAMDPWGEPERFTRTVTITEPNQLVVVKPVASGHAEWSVRVDGAAKVTGYTHSWPKGDREFIKR